MSNLRQAAQQALQAMQFAGNAHEFAVVAADLEAALAEPEQKVWCDCGDSIEPDSGAKCGNCVAGDSAEPEQEPVAWMQEMPVSGNEERSVRMTTVKMVADEWDNPIPLYTAPTTQPDTDCHAQGICQRSGYSIAPTPRKPLTEDEIADLWDGHTVPVFGKIGINPIVFARAIERAHGIGEQHEQQHRRACVSAG